MDPWKDGNVVHKIYLIPTRPAIVAVPKAFGNRNANPEMDFREAAELRLPKVFCRKEVQKAPQSEMDPLLCQIFQMCT
jgi:hypothetical protein